MADSCLLDARVRINISIIIALPVSEFLNDEAVIKVGVGSDGISAGTGQVTIGVDVIRTSA